MHRPAKIIAIAAALILLGAGCAKSPAPAANQNANVTPVGYSRYKPASGEMAIKIADDNSFDPTSAYVITGTKVTFTNASKNKHNLSPDEDTGKKGLADFGTKADLAPGESYSYTFAKTGRWFYYDKLHPSFGGVVEVMDKAESRPDANQNVNKSERH